MQQAPKSREELLEHLLGEHKLVPDKELTEADAAALTARHEQAHEDAYEGHEPHT
jgi:hypothetical protein